ncbi:hypothetical protein C2845_PM04G33450 [Panicum miliaceum]|uniref:Uncharacterized protein n=1 Tax=Panicum miliaceum TaxID=4540 RepID=A0A3L6QPW2_PANMI|nr:hypothetical protein C2845_PM04G33450 [Panicum miliaceum]
MESVAFRYQDLVRVKDWGVPVEAAGAGGWKGQPWQSRHAVLAAAAPRIPCDGVAQGLEVEAVLAAQAAWEQWDAAASMAGSLDMVLDSPQLLSEQGADGSISAPDSSALNKDTLDGQEQSFQVPAASLEDSNDRINRQVYACDRSTHGTSTLWHHLRFLCPQEPLKGQDLQRTNQGTPKHSFSIEDCRKALAEMVIIDEMPFRSVKVKYSKDIPKYCNQDLKSLLESQ